MANVNFLNGFNSNFYAYDQYFAFSSFVSASDTEYTFMSTSGDKITLRGENIVINGSDRFTSGQITQIDMFLNTSNQSVVSTRIDDIEVDGTDIMGSNGANIPSRDEIWRTLFDGGVSFSGAGQRNGPNYVYGDGAEVTNLAIDGNDVTVRADFAGNGTYIASSANVINGTSIVDSGVLDFRGFGTYVMGDAYSQSGSSLLRGGDDTIIFTDPFNPTFVASSTVRGSGDVYNLGSTAILHGGDDIVDASRLSNPTITSTDLVGDARSISSSAVLFGGDDDLIGARLSNLMFGDARSISSSSVRAIGGDDRIFGKIGDDIISGDFGTVAAGAIVKGGNDAIFGGAGDDEIYGDIQDSAIFDGNGGDDVINSGGGNDTVYGQGGDDLLIALDGNTTIYGGADDDVFRPNFDGSHTFFGGTGEDTVNYFRAVGRLDIDLVTNSHGGWAADDSLSSVENVFGSNTHTDFIYGTFGANRIVTGGASDFVDGRGGGDVINTGDQNDRIDAGFGNNTYDGGSGFDLLSYENSGAGVRVDLQNNWASGGYAENDKITGIEHVYGSSHGDDRLFGDELRNRLAGRDGDDLILGRRGDDFLYGNGNNDSLYGGFDDDFIFGGSGSDYIEGDGGNDFLNGGLGPDTFHYDRGDDIDRIMDFQNNFDVIELDGFPPGYNPFANAFMSNGHVVMNFGFGDRLIVENITIAALQNDVVLV